MTSITTVYIAIFQFYSRDYLIILLFIALYIYFFFFPSFLVNKIYSKTFCSLGDDLYEKDLIPVHTTIRVICFF